MSFPSSGDMAAFGRLLRHHGLYDRITARRPDLADRIESEDGLTSVISVAIGQARKVVIAEGHVKSAVGSWPVWLIADPSSSLRPRFWSTRTDEDVLADAFLERVDAWLERRPESSPWRWDEPSISTIVALADLLAEEGFVASQVVAKNRVRGVYRDGDYRLVVTEGSDSRDFLTVPTSDGELRVYRTAAFGWLANLRSAARWHRVDLGRLLTGHVSALPGVAEASTTVADVAAALLPLLSSLSETPCPDIGNDSTPDAAAPPQDPFEHSVRELHRFGFGDISADSSGHESPLISDTLHLVHWSRDAAVSVGAVKQHFADAVVVGRRLLLVSDCRVTKPAMRFADQAGVLVLKRDRMNGEIWPSGITEQLRFGSALED